MKKILLIALFSIAFLERTIFDLGPNVELITTAIILSSYLFGKKETFWLTLLILIASDIIIGNTAIFLFTWSGFLIPALFSKNLINQLSKLADQPLPKSNFATKLIFLTPSGLTANLFFYLWSNFGVWLLDSWNMYPNTLQGLIKCYVNALPFFKNQLLGTLIFIPSSIISIKTAKYFLPKVKLYQKAKIVTANR